MWGYGYIFVLIYVGLVLGTCLKFKENGVRVDRKSYYMFAFLPIITLYLHGILIAKYIKEKRRISLDTLFFPVTHFPLIIGVFIEILLEKQAQKVANKSRAIDKTRRPNKKVQSINTARKSVGFDLRIIKDAVSLYKNKLVSHEVS